MHTKISRGPVDTTLLVVAFSEAGECKSEHARKVTIIFTLVGGRQRPAGARLLVVAFQKAGECKSDYTRKVTIIFYSCWRSTNISRTRKIIISSSVPW